MAKQFWINLPVSNINASKAFFTKLGFKFNLKQGDSPNSACLMLGENNVACMLYDKPTFENCIDHEAPISKTGVEVLLSIDAQSKGEVDEMIKLAIEAGGASHHQPGEMNSWMYGGLFSDLDGHRWNVMYMDLSKMNEK